MICLSNRLNALQIFILQQLFTKGHRPSIVKHQVGIGSMGFSNQINKILWIINNLMNTSFFIFEVCKIIN